MSESQEGNSGDPANACVQHQLNNAFEAPRPSDRNVLLSVLIDPPGRLEEGPRVMYAVSVERRSDWVQDECLSKDAFFSLSVANRFALDLFIQEVQKKLYYKVEPMPLCDLINLDGEFEDNAGGIKWEISNFGELSFWARDDEYEIRRVWVQRHFVKGDPPSQSESSKNRNIADNSSKA